MKIKLLASFLFLTAIAGARLEAGTEPVPSGFKLVSPDHPSTFEVGFNDKVGQSLRWYEGEGMLYLDITYSRITYTDLISPANLKTYTVSFPGVMLDAGNRLYVLNKNQHKIIIGSRTYGPFGLQVKLSDGITISAHRRGGRINAILKAGGDI